MIKVNKCGKCYPKNVQVFQNLDIEITAPGLYGIVGPSGCGKSTLLNILGCFDTNYVGSVIIDGHELKNLPPSTQADFRLRYIGVVFQDSYLFNNLTVKENLQFVNELSLKKQNILSLLRSVNLPQKSNIKAGKLSGGERQRLCIARALVNHPEIILCDEPTGALDRQNALDVFNLLKKISQHKIVIVVSHDLELMRMFAEEVFMFQDNKFFPQNREWKPAKNNPIQASEKLKIKNMLHLCWRNAMAHKIRTFFSGFITSLALIVLGISLCLPASFSRMIDNSFGSLIQANNIIVTAKERKLLSANPSFLGEKECQKIAQDWREEIRIKGVNYFANFENNFKDENTVNLVNKEKSLLLTDYQIRNINDFVHLEEISFEQQFYPSRPEIVENDEVVLGINNRQLSNIARVLDLAKPSFASLTEYLTYHSLNIVLSFKNKSWQYEDQQILQCRTVVYMEKPVFIHTNPLWNEYMLESMMRFPTTDLLDDSQVAPWTLVKGHYFIFTSSFDKDKLLNNPFSHAVFSPLILEDKITNRYLIYQKQYQEINYSSIEEMVWGLPYLSSYVIGNKGTYFFANDSLLSGFRKDIYLVNSLADPLFFDKISGLSDQEINQVVLPSGIVSGTLYNAMFEGINFATSYKRIIVGRAPEKCDEIVISQKLAQKLFSDGIPLQKIDFVMESSKNVLLDKYLRTFKTCQIEIVGITDDDSKCLVYQKPNWLIEFFRDFLEVSSLEMNIDSLSLNIQEKHLGEIMELLKRNYPQFEFSSPSYSMRKTVNKTISSIQIPVLAFSGISFVLAIFLVAIIIQTVTYENRYEHGLLLAIGVKNHSVRFLAIFDGCFLNAISVLLSVFVLEITKLAMAFFPLSNLAFQLIIPYWIYAFLALLLLSLCVLIGTLVTKKMATSNVICLLKRQ